MTTPLDLPKLAEAAEKLRKLREKASVGEWFTWFGINDNGCGDLSTMGEADGEKPTDHILANFYAPNADNNREYVVALKNANLESAVPLLIAEIERLRTAVFDLEGMLDAN